VEANGGALGPKKCKTRAWYFFKAPVLFCYTVKY
jgi:hypothetical protein